MHPKFPRVSFLVLGLLSVPALSSAQDAAAPAEVPVEDHTAEFKTLDADLARLDDLFDQYHDPVHKLTILGYINLIKGRAEALGWKRPADDQYNTPSFGGGRGGPRPVKVEWDQTKYEELRYDINLQGQRLANYLAPLRTPPPSAVAHRTLAVAKLKPSPTDPAEVKAALDALDFEIRRLETRTAALALGSAEREAENARLSRVKERRIALGREFTKARWDALVGDLK